MLFEQVVTYKFKGKRDYVPGVDIYDSMLALTNQHFGAYPTSVKGAFHRFLRRCAIYRIFPETETLDVQSCHAHFQIQLNHETYQLSATGTDQKIVDSHDYNENQVADNISWSEKSALIIVKPRYTYMEQLVAVTKKLHLKLYPEALGKWIFTKIQINDFLDPEVFTGHSLKVEAGKNFHNKLTQNFITLDGKSVGDIWFSHLSKESIT